MSSNISPRLAVTRLTVIPGLPRFSRTVQLLDPRSPAGWSSSKRSNGFLHTGRDCVEGNPPGTINAAFVLWETQLDKYCTVRNATPETLVYNNTRSHMNQYLPCTAKSNETPYHTLKG